MEITSPTAPRLLLWLDTCTGAIVMSVIMAKFADAMAKMPSGTLGRLVSAECDG